jgi:hypothetical protein
MKSNVPDKLASLLNELKINGFINTTRLTVVKKWFSQPKRLLKLRILSQIKRSQQIIMKCVKVCSVSGFPHSKKEKAYQLAFSSKRQ